MHNICSSRPRQASLAKFSPLSIAQPGRYRTRVISVLPHAAKSPQRSMSTPGGIHVHAGAEAVQRPTPLRISKLQL
ncbi:uncharacterized protein P174DRAFT_515929 [Aspergillus novofumigatus IBT 16806]|uniref:Uncharacterized protein n=1 Tax=Aspergillus novofumigatus (strain IBT 16806) TaxID=1392255 RepID=A0A2I1BV29_ASPN1|nr:uncharacterized protein P174DRAFT_515929 [Aspergillus novofumigatus IBT 16806]PKX89214.1 hypothetical protein P174DRAFT_515929 [Aspergillus novofumigatus IBT 16806]